MTDGERVNPPRGLPFPWVIRVMVLLGLVLAPAVTFSIVYRVLQRPLIRAEFGDEAVARGVHVVGRHGRLSDGRELSGNRSLELSMGSGLAAVAVGGVSLAILKRLTYCPRYGVRWKR